MRKIFSILVVLMVISLTFMSCTPATGDTKNGTGSSTGTDTTALENFMKETFDNFTKSDNGKVYSGKIKGTENDYVLIPAKAAVPTTPINNIDNDNYSFGDAKLHKEGSVEGKNIYCYSYSSNSYYFTDLDENAHTIKMSQSMIRDYFDNDYNINEPITIGGITFYIKY